MTLSRYAAALLDYLSARHGRRVGEAEIRTALSVSHGTFIAARRELVDRGALLCEPGGGNLPPVYHVPDAAKRPSGQPKSCRAGGETLTEAAAMARVDGEFASVDDWVDALTAVLGDVDVSECFDGSYAVYSHRSGQSAVYTAAFGAHGVTFS